MFCLGSICRGYMDDDDFPTDECRGALATLVYTIDYGKQNHTFIHKMRKLADESRVLVEDEMDYERQKRQLDLLETSLGASRRFYVTCSLCKQDKYAKCYDSLFLHDPPICRSCNRELRYPRRCKSQ